MTLNPFSRLKKRAQESFIKSLGHPIDGPAPKDALQGPQAKVEDGSLPLEPPLLRAAESASTGSLTISSTVPLTTASMNCQPTPFETLHAATPLLWTHAYDALKNKDRKLVEEYEVLLSRELPLGTGSGVGDNAIDDNNVEVRQERLNAIMSKGLQRVEENKAKYAIFGHEFVVRNQITNATRFINAVKGLVDEAVKASPQAALAWAGVCIILPVLTNPVAAEEANRDGFTYVTSRIAFYIKLESLLWPTSLALATDLRRELEQRIVELYQHILEFQIRTVLRFYRTWLVKAGKDMAGSEDWGGMLSKIQERERTISADLQRVNDSAMRMELEEIKNNTDRFLAEVSSLLTALIDSRRDSASLAFNNHSSGNQFNATGGTQNNSTGSGMQFSGATFHSVVHFNRKER